MPQHRNSLINLALLKSTRVSKGITLGTLADLTGIAPKRLRELDSLSRRHEPWLDEAEIISRALCTNGITPLITSDHLTTLHLDPDIGGDLRALRAGLRLPLSSAIRLSIRFNLPDPANLLVDPLTRQLWALMESNERHPEASGWCPCCAANVMGGEDHLPTCLPNVLWGRDYSLQSTITVKPRPSRIGHNDATVSSIGHGLRRLREEAGERAGRKVTQQEFADLFGVNVNHYARQERGDLPVVLGAARKIAEHLGVTVEAVYARPGEQGVVPDEDNGSAGA